MAPIEAAFESFENQQRKNFDQFRSKKAQNDQEIKLDDLKKFADSFKLHTLVPLDLLLLMTKNPAKQKEVQEKAKRNAEKAQAHPSEIATPIVPVEQHRTIEELPPASLANDMWVISSQSSTAFLAQYAV